MGDVLNENRSYIEWLAENAQKPEFKTAAKLLLAGKQQPAADDKAHEDFDPTTIIASSKQTSEIANLAGELATQTKNGTPLSVTNEVIQQIVPDWKGTDDDWKNLTVAQAEDAKSQLQGLLAAFDKKINIRIGLNAAVTESTRWVRGPSIRTGGARWPVQ